MPGHFVPADPGPKQSAGPGTDAALDAIEHVTSTFADRCFAFDQFGPLSIRPCHGTCWAPRKKPARLLATGHRTHRVRYFHGCCCLADDQLWGITWLRTGGGHTLAALKSIRAARPDGAPIYVILDNLSADKTPPIRTWAAKHKVRLCFTPVNASWANPIEAQFGPTRTFAMGSSDHPNHAVLARRRQAYLAWRNANARHPDVLAAQRRERARIRSERQQRWGHPKTKAA
jgi:DDE superfamily endonuclease